MFEDNQNSVETKSGWLLKWTNYIKGYRRRWFVLQSDNLSYYRDSSEVAYAQRGTIHIMNIVIHTYNSCSFVISKGESKNAFYLKAANSTERDEWVQALKRAKGLVNARLEQVQDTLINDNYNEHQIEILMIFHALGTCLESLQKYNSIINKQGQELKNLFVDIERTKETEISNQKKKIKECMILFRTTSSAMVNACIAFFGLAVVKYNKVHNLLTDQIETRKVLEEFVENLFKLNLLLSTAIRNRDDKTFNELKSFSLLLISKEGINKKYCTNHDNCSTRSSKLENESLRPELNLEFDSYSSHESLNFQLPDEVLKMSSAATVFAKTSGFKIRKKYDKVRRTRIPDKPIRSLNLWSIMKNCIGKDLSRIPMPVNFSEPLSFLQRTAEDFTYSRLLDHAATCKDSNEELAYLAAFAVSCYASTAYRTAKPFNPLLGETYEWDRTDDLGWRLISEQVSHHPPIAAQHCESKEWTCWQEFAMSSKFRGKYLMIIPLGISHIIFHTSGNHYSWTKVTTTVNNIIIGKLWVDNAGQMVITNHKNNSKCVLNFIPYSMFRADDQKKVMGEIATENDDVRWVINGKWDSQITIAPAIGNQKKSANSVYKIGLPITVWTAEVISEESEKYYNFSTFACQLNEMEAGVAPSDSRHRPDQKLMEEGKWDEANSIKLSLEEKQRAVRKRSSCSERSSEVNTPKCSNESNTDQPSYEPTWFTTEVDVDTSRVTYVYKGGYWEAKEKQDWSRCPDIYL